MRREASSAGRRRSRAGQTMIFLLAVVVALAFVVLWNFDLHKTLAVKLRSQNGGDAAALAAARWQGLSLNLIGQLNVLQAVAILDALVRGDGDFGEARAIAGLQARLCYVGPVVGLSAAQQAAKQNGLFVHAGFTDDLARHAGIVAATYPARFRPPYPDDDVSGLTAWDDYAQMIWTVAANGVAAAPDHPDRYADYIPNSHPLLDPGFYDAVASLDWCWFLHNAYDLLRSYREWRDWPALPVIVRPDPMNSEFFSLRLGRAETLEDIPGLSQAGVQSLRRELERLTGRAIRQEVVRVEAAWFVYDPSAWGRWSDLYGDDFPFEGRVKSEYDYIGADAAVRVETALARVTPGIATDAIAWTAAAKPFGFLEGPTRPNRWGLVLPAFREVRLVPVDAATGSAGGSRPEWAMHIYTHLPDYSERGLEGLHPGCWYCAQLRQWEEPAFRQAGIEWLRLNSAACQRTPRPGGGGGGGGAPSGGTRRGH